MPGDRTYEEVIAAWGDSSDGRTEEAWLWDEVLAARKQRDRAARLAGSLDLALADAERKLAEAVAEVERLRAEVEQRPHPNAGCGAEDCEACDGSGVECVDCGFTQDDPQAHRCVCGGELQACRTCSAEVTSG